MQNITVAEETVATGELLAGAYDPDGDIVTLVNFTMPLNGMASIRANGSFAYMGNTNYFGPDMITFLATDGQGNYIQGFVYITVSECFCV